MNKKFAILGKLLSIASCLTIMLLMIDLSYLHNFQYLYAELATYLRLFPDERVFACMFTHTGVFISGFITLLAVFTISCFSIYLVGILILKKYILKVREYISKTISLMSRNMLQGIILGSALTGVVYVGVFLLTVYGYFNYRYVPFERPNVLLEKIYLTPLLVLFLDAIEKSKFLLVIATALHWPVVCVIGALLLDKVQRVKSYNGNG